MNEKTVIISVTILALASMVFLTDSDVVATITGGLIGYLRGKED